MAKLIETGKHQAIPVQGRLHGKQILMLAQIIQGIIDRNGGWADILLELRGGDLTKARIIDESYLMAPDKITLRQAELLPSTA